MKFRPSRARDHRAGVRVGMLAIAGTLVSTAALADGTATNFSRTASYIIRDRDLAVSKNVFLNDQVVNDNPAQSAVASISKSIDDRTGSAGGAAESRATAGFGRLGVGVEGEAFAEAFGRQPIIDAQASASFRDTWTVKDKDPTRNDGKHTITYHFVVGLDGTMTANATGHQQFPPRQHFADGDAGVTVFVGGTGIHLNEGIAGQVNRVIASENLPLPAPDVPIMHQIDYTATIIEGVPTPVFLSLTVLGEAGALDHDIDPSDSGGDFSADFTHTLQWLPGGFFTDGDTPDGGRLDDVTLTAASGFDYMHPAFPAGGVPEPAEWALMLAGFGLIGATLRGRRPLTA